MSCVCWWKILTTCHGSLHGNVPPTRCQAADAAVVRGQRAASDDVPWPMVIACWTPGYQSCFMMISLGSLHMISFCDFSINNDHGFHQASFFFDRNKNWWTIKDCDLTIISWWFSDWIGIKLVRISHGTCWSCCAFAPRRDFRDLVPWSDINVATVKSQKEIVFTSWGDGQWWSSNQYFFGGLINPLSWTFHCQVGWLYSWLWHRHNTNIIICIYGCVFF